MFDVMKAWVVRVGIGPQYVRVRFRGETTMHYREWGLSGATLCARWLDDKLDPLGRRVFADGPRVCQTCRLKASNGTTRMEPPR